MIQNKNNKIEYLRGSEWRKWDLHIHSPCSGLNNQYPKRSDGSPEWGQFIKRLEEIKDVAVLGITDYFTIEGYKKVLEFRKDDGLKNFDLILPNIEFRLNNVLSSKKDGKAPKRLTLHVIFSDEVPSSQIEDQFLHELSFCYEGNPQDKDEIRKLKPSSIKDLGKKLKKEHEKFKDRTDFEIGCMNAVVNHEDIAAILNEKPSIFKGKYLIIFAEEYTNLIDWDSQDHNIRKVLLQKSDCIFSGSPRTKSWALGKLDLSPEKFIKEFKTLKSCIFGSDAHSLDKICKPDNNKFTWIKSDPTFEGLKQIIYEPELRVKIQKDNPTESETFTRINKCSMNFPEDLEIRDSESGEKSSFCLHGSYEINFSNNLTCIIGGRGSGKSTLIHILYNEWAKKELNRLYEVDSPLVNLALSPDALSKISDFVTTDIPVNIEFFLQNEVEKFAKDIGGMSKLIRHRLERLSSINDSQQSLQELEKSWTTSASEVNDLIDAYDNITNFDKEIRLLNKEITTLKKQTEVIKSKEYKKIQSDIEKIAANISDFKNYEKEYKEVVDNLVILSRSISRLDWKKFNNQELLNEIVVQIDKYQTQLDVNFQRSKREFKKKEYTKNLQEKKSELKRYLETKGISAENIDELADATEKINNLESQVKNLTLKKLPYQEIYKQKDKILESYREGYNAYIIRFFDTTDKLQKNLHGLEFTEKTEITFHQKVNNQPLKKAVIDFIKNNNRSKISLSADNIETVIFSDINIQELVADKKKIRETINRSQRATIHTQVLKELLNEDSLLERLYLRMQKYNFDISNIQIQTKLGGKPLQKTSFGERCGIVIAIVLVAGTNPIIIDQPEDNLDGKFISKVLVPLIRRQKQNRQIILITRDANIVIGGDSELIEILESERERTTLIPSTIENKSNRSKYVWILDGGEKAFQKREQKYSFKQ